MSMTYAQRKKFFRTLSDRERVQLQQKKLKEQQLLRRLQSMADTVKRQSEKMQARQHHSQMEQLSIF